MPEPHDHGENHIELPFVEPVAMSLYLRMHDVLRSHRLEGAVGRGQPDTTLDDQGPTESGRCVEILLWWNTTAVATKKLIRIASAKDGYRGKIGVHDREGNCDPIGAELNYKRRQQVDATDAHVDLLRVVVGLKVELVNRC